MPTILKGQQPGGSWTLDVPFEFSDPSDDRRHHTAVRRRQIEGQSIHRDDRHAPRLELLQSVQEIEGAASPAGKLGHQYRINLSPLRQAITFFRSARSSLAPEPVSLKTLIIS